MGVTGTVQFESNVTTRNETDPIVATGTSDMEFRVDITDGTGADQCNKLFSETNSLSASTPEEHNLRSLTSPIGEALVFTKVKSLMIINTGDNPIIIGGAASNAWEAPFSAGALITLPAGGVFCIADFTTGWTVDATHRQLKIDPGALACEYQIQIAGV